MTPTITLRAITEAEFAKRREVLIEGYGEAIAGAGNLSPERARADARKQTDTLLPDGIATAGMLMWIAEVAGTPVGWVWVALPDPPRRELAWVYDIEVFDGNRGRGYGRGIMLAAEAELVARGVRRLGLNAFGDNAVAIRLYESLGFRVTSQQMAKSLPWRSSAG